MVFGNKHSCIGLGFSCIVMKHKEISSAKIEDSEY